MGAATGERLDEARPLGYPQGVSGTGHFSTTLAPMDEWKLAADGHGVITVADLRRAGLDANRVASLVNRGELTPLARGWYAVGRPSTAAGRHILATRAMLRLHEGRAVASHHSALLLMELPTYQARLDTVRLSRCVPGSPRTRAGQRLGRTVPPEARVGQTVTPAVAVVQHGISSGPMSALVAADGALHQGRATVDDITHVLDWARHHPGSGAVRDILQLADGRRESPGETRLAHTLHVMNVAVTPQFEVSAPGFTARVDFVVDGEMVVIEFDGRVKYQRGDDDVDAFGRALSPQEVVWREKRREDRIRELGYEVVRVVWSDLDDPVTIARRIQAAIQRARERNGLRSA